MRPFIKTWLTLCLLLPLAAHATTREQRLPSGFSGHTARTETTQASNTENTPVRQHAPVPVQAVTKAETRKRGSRVADNSKRGKGSKTIPAIAKAPTKQGSQVIARAVDALGTPYRWGGNTPGKGLDCSGLVKYAFNDVKSVNLPRTSRDMASGHGVEVARKDLKPGDLIFFKTRGRQVNHVAIYMGDNQFIHAPSRGKAVTIDSLNKPYWNEHFAVAKRVLKPAPQAQMRLASNDSRHPR
ncbi:MULTISPECIES: C40 family peptidase [unclassified Pseudomonas]|uniref:C40 family peptidase n=1 Tax=unclassified Pseudomonas TaxID=196821 RepID=UPI000BCCC724|nr:MULTISPECIES: C40 family peptidase [unclassified Pseudomonas]PVZ15537.1 chitinase [Pseudomonas sp. URIL14HWK12:I12]PVZ24911.1 chitinase [Pseudomonas sp. URIL14HWK12:I10]PVZ34757.1 chitinase [Pseudomonas sp. URIL14HWK12:I11]SNZ09203.1 chitinase [Pseudomonas sp. URIL14HWK12:I9]